MLQSLHARLLGHVAYAPDKGGSDPDELTLDDPVDTEIDPDDDEDIRDPAGEPDEEPPLAADAGTQPAGDEPRRSRAGEAIRSLRARAQETERRAQEAERRADEAERRARDYEARQRPQQTAVDPEAERRYLESLPPEQQVDYKLNKALERFQTVQQAQSFRQMDMLDKTQFDAECRYDPLARKYANEVEKELTRIRNEGGNVPREAVLNYVLGRALREKQRLGSGTRAAAGERRVRAAATRPTNARGDVASDRGRASESLEKRLENVPL